MDALTVHRIHFAFTITFHYLFPQLTMGLALLIVVLKSLALRTGNSHYNDAARFWARIFGINFVVGVVTGIPMEFQFGTNWSAFSKEAGGVIGQRLSSEHFCSVNGSSARASTGFRPSWFFSAPGFPDFSLSRPMPGCSIRSAICRTATVRFRW